MMHFIRNVRIGLFAAAAMSLCLCLGGISAQAADRVQPVGDNIVIVIDPGHGGDNHGTESGHTVEKEMTMATAKAMFQELSQYDNVTVYLTHSEDRDMSLEDRAVFAESVGADFLFSIHYNASENHTMFGSEVWVSCQAPYNAYGYQFAYGHLLAMRERGLFVRGVKTRIDKGADYYGVIRESVARSIPALIIEHCYVDEERDAEYIKNAEDWAEFGRMDALSVAKYFGLKSTALGVDYSGEASQLESAAAESLVQQTLRDQTPPDICLLELDDCNYDTGEVTLTVSAADYDSPLLYYDYSLDGGLSWSRWEIWPGADALTGDYKDTFQLNLHIPDGLQPNIILRAYNKADLDTESNVLQFDQVFSYNKDGEDVQEPQAGDEPATEPPEHSRKSVGTTTFMPAGSDAVEGTKTEGIMGFLKLCLILVIVIFFAVLVSQIVGYRRRKRRRRDGASKAGNRQGL